MPPAISVSPTSFDFGAVRYSSSVEKSFTVRNSGGGTLTIGTMGYSKGNQYFYTNSNGCVSKQLSAGQTCTIVIMVYTGGDISAPVGSYSDTFTIQSNAGSASMSLAFNSPEV